MTGFELWTTTLCYSCTVPEKDTPKNWEIYREANNIKLDPASSNEGYIMDRLTPPITAEDLQKSKLNSISERYGTPKSPTDKKIEEIKMKVPLYCKDIVDIFILKSQFDADSQSSRMLLDAIRSPLKEVLFSVNILNNCLKKGA